MEYRVTEDGCLIAGLGVVQTKTLADYDEIGRALEKLAKAARCHVAHMDDFPDGPKAPSSARYGELYPAGLRAADWGIEYPGRPTCLDYPEGDPAWIDWGLIRFGSANYALEDRLTARLVLVECLAQDIDPEDMVAALRSTAVQIERYARRRGGAAAA